jgi:hypothetical protein
MKIRRRGNKARLLVVLSDLHCGHRLGLLAPNTELLEIDANGESMVWMPSLGPTQEYLWQLYQGHLDSIMGRGLDVTLLVNGDLTHGTKYRDALFTESINDQCVVAEQCLTPWLDAGVRTLRIIRGTGSHTLEGSTEGMIANLLGKGYPKADIAIVGHGLFDVNGFRFDVAHHGPSKGIREWTSGNQARYYLKSLMLSEIGRGNEPPHWVVRSHFHSYMPPERVNAAGRTAEIVLTPSYCGMNGHGRQATRSQHVQSHGLVLFEIGEGRCQFEKMVETLDLRSRESL